MQFPFRRATNLGRAARSKALQTSIAPVLQPLEGRILFTIFTVVNSTDSAVEGSGSLRDAITQANNTPGVDEIDFHIVASGVQTISPTTALPPITEDVLIDGTTQPGFTHSPLIEINGAGTSAVDGLSITANGVALKGLIINNFDGNGVTATNVSGTTITGCYIGTDKTGAAASGNGADGIFLDNVTGAVIGGVNADEQNLLSGNTGYGVNLDKGSGNVVAGNYIGTNLAGTAALGNLSGGVRLFAPDGDTVGGATNIVGKTFVNLISGNSASGIFALDGSILVKNDISNIWHNVIGLNAAQTARIANAGNGITISATDISVDSNVIAGNNGNGIQLITHFANEVYVTNNTIGVISGATKLGNTHDGVRIGGSEDPTDNGPSNNQIGGTSACAAVNVSAGAAGTGANFIAYNGGNGVNIYGGVDNLGNSSVQNQISKNSIHDNTLLGIDIGNNGVTPNDPGDGDKDANLQQNFPVITSAVTASGATTIKGSIASAPNQNYTIEFFSSPTPSASNYGEGATFIGSAQVHTNGSGNAAFTFTPASPVGAGVVTATATDFIGTDAHDTSEFSKAFPVTVPPPPPPPPAQHNIVAKKREFTAKRNNNFTEWLASFVDTAPGTHVKGDYTATVNWGDNTGTQSALITTDPTTAGGFRVAATHKYTVNKVYNVVITISAAGSPPVTINERITVVT